MQAYCVKCKTKREMSRPVASYSDTGRAMTKGTCEVCGTALTVFGESEAHQQLARPSAEAIAAAKAAKPTKPKSTASKADAAKGNGKTGAGKPKTKTKASKASEAKSPSPKRAKSGENGGKRSGKLVIVESPAKARTVGNFLGKGYTVIASKGHVRDLLVTQLSVDVENDFEPKYRVPNEKRDVVSEIKQAAERAEHIYLATDPDREGEAIAWHLMQAAEIPTERTQRVVFHEITDQAVQDAFQHPREIDMSLVNAQQARRILDRLVGYNITELLWDKVRNRLSAGRVQSIALRIVVDREREIEAFVAKEYWTIDVSLSKQHSTGKRNSSFVAHLAKLNGEDLSITSAEEAQPHVDALRASVYQVVDVKTGTRQRKPSPPFTTSTLQQEASRRLGFSAQRTMRAAQDLYEGIELSKGQVFGLITYMRTDSLNVSEQAQSEAREYISTTFGAEFMPAQAPKYKTKAKGAQEAHEAIRPTSVLRRPDEVKPFLSRDQYALYRLVWERFLASQMSPALYDTVRAEIAAGASLAAMPYGLRAAGSRIQFKGFLALYEDARDEDVAQDDDEGRYLPELQPQEALDLQEVLPEQHFTQAAPRYTEASLVRTLEEYGIGRPSTYAPTVGVIQDRDYVTKQDKRLVPTETGRIVSDLLTAFFPSEMDYQFTARMEDQLDDVAEGDGEWKPMLRQFYQPFSAQLKHARDHMPTMKQEEQIGRDCPSCGGQLVLKYGRWGKFIGCANYPTCTYTEQYLETTGVSCPKCGEADGGELIARRTRRGKLFYGCSRYPACDFSAWKLPNKASEDERVGDEAMPNAANQ